MIFIQKWTYYVLCRLSSRLIYVYLGWFLNPRMDKLFLLWIWRKSKWGKVLCQSFKEPVWFLVHQFAKRQQYISDRVTLFPLNIKTFQGLCHSDCEVDLFHCYHFQGGAITRKAVSYILAWVGDDSAKTKVSWAIILLSSRYLQGTCLIDRSPPGNCCLSSAAEGSRHKKSLLSKDTFWKIP